MTDLFQRDAVSRARQFLDMARKCSVDQRDEYEALIEAAMVFGRTAMHRLLPLFGAHPGWKTWFGKYLGNASVQFFKVERDYLLKEGPTKVGQVIRAGKRTERAEEHYYFESPGIPATDTIEHHLDHVAGIVAAAHQEFGHGAK